MRVPSVYTASEIATWTVSEEYEPGKWRPARPCSFQAESIPSWWDFFKMRCRIAWMVFTGECDALRWGPKSGTWKNSQCNYKDLTDPSFIRAGKEKP